MDVVELAKAAYQAYGETTDFKNFQGNPMPTWEDLPETIRRAWMAAALKVALVTLTSALAKRDDQP